jgi:hypothetical protein
VHKWIDDPQICQVEFRQQSQALQNDPGPGMMAAFLVTNHWLSLWDSIVVSYVQYERPLFDKVSFAPILAAISSLIFRVNWASLRPMRSSNHALNGTRDAINGLCGGEIPLCVTMAPWRYSIGEKAPLV